MIQGCVSGKITVAPWSNYTLWVFQSCLTGWILFLSFCSPLGDRKFYSPMWTEISHLLPSGRSLLPMYQNHFANQIKTKKMEKVEIFQNCAFALKKISNIGLEAARIHVQTRTGLKYTCLKLRQKLVISSLQLVNSNATTGNWLWLQLKLQWISQRNKLLTQLKCFEVTSKHLSHL